MEASQSAAITAAVNKNKARSIVVSNTIEDQAVSHFIAQYDVPRKTEGKVIRFKKPTLNLVSRFVYDRLETKLLEVNTEEMITVLLKNDETTSMNDICPKYYEKLLARKLASTNGLNCVQREVALAAQDQNVGPRTAAEWRKYNCKLTKVVEGAPPFFD